MNPTGRADARRVRVVSPVSMPVAPWGMQNRDNLAVYEYAHRLALATYRHTASYPPAERFGITSQMRRGAVSIASTICEGCGRRSNRELLQYLYMATGSANELACQLRIATDLGFGNPESADQLRTEVERVGKMLTRLISFLRNQPAWRNKEDRP